MSTAKIRPDPDARKAGEEQTQQTVALRHRSLAPGLHIVSTPLGNLGDITLRAPETLHMADVIACEDTRTTAKLTSHYGITTPRMPYHDHNGAAMRPKLLKRLAAGQAVALVSDAGTPLVSDPGMKLVAEVAAAGHTVTAIPGASAALFAVAVAGLPSDRFMFAGFLPQKSGGRRRNLAELAGVPSTLIFYETGSRLAATLEDMAELLGSRRAAAVVREATKLYEEVVRGSLEELALRYKDADAIKGEITVAVGPPDGEVAQEIDLDQLLTAELKEASLKQAVANVTAKTGLPRKAVYARALNLKD
jgi:16S rRNA (cytidine1402-2'-O)-methyltransferase